MRASKSATGSVKLIFVYLLLSSPVCSGSAGEPAVTYYRSTQPSALSHQPERRGLRLLRVSASKCPCTRCSRTGWML